MIRPTTIADIPQLVRMAHETGVFKPLEIEALQGVLDDYFESQMEDGDVAVTDETDGELLGFAYYAPIPMTDNTWSLYWIVVGKKTQARGIGGQLLKHCEDDIRGKGGRVLLIETSALPHYDLTRRFYLKHGYDQEATIRDYYSDGDDLVMFWKKFI